MDRTWSPPRQVGEYALVRLLGQGAMGQVWLARDGVLEREVAIKFATAIYGARDGTEQRLRFLCEARALARLRHPNVIAVHHAAEVDGRPYLVTELLGGQSLDHLAIPLEPSEAISIGIGLARGLAAAHKAGILHRDVKPANAFLCQSGVPKLLDFGLAKLTDPGELAMAATAVDPQDVSSETVGPLGPEPPGHRRGRPPRDPALPGARALG